MDYRYLTAFLATARMLSISKAAKELSVAQSAISRQIALLETSLGVDLFFRGTRGVTLTPKGKLIYHRLSENDNWIKSEFVNESLPIRICGLEGVINHWLGPKLAKVPEIDFSMRLALAVMNDDQIKIALENKEFDLGLSSRKLDSEWITSRKLYSEKIVLISARPIDLEKLESYCWIGIEKATYLHRITRNKKPQSFIQAGSLDLLFKFVVAGHGIAAVPEGLVGSYKVRSYPTSLGKEAIFLNLPSYKRQPQYINKFISKFLSE